MFDLRSKLFDYKLHLSIVLISIVSLYGGTINISIIGGLNIVILPLIVSIFFSIIFYSVKSIFWIGKQESEISSMFMLIIICPLIAKLAISSGQNINFLLDIGPILLLEELGDIGTILLGLPIALLLGFKREAIGMTSSICREPQMSVLIDKYGVNSSEVRGFFTVYIIGIVLGTFFVTLIVNFLVYVLPLHPYSYALASGIGSTSMNVAIVSSLSAIYPYLTDKLLALSGISNLISLIFSIYVYIFISLPLTERLYNKFNSYFN